MPRHDREVHPRLHQLLRLDLQHGHEHLRVPAFEILHLSLAWQFRARLSNVKMRRPDSRVHPRNVVPILEYIPGMQMRVSFLWARYIKLEEGIRP